MSIIVWFWCQLIVMFNLQAWFETEYGNNNVDITCGSRTAESISYSYIGTSSADATGENRKESTYLYIQMEYCPRYIYFINTLATFACY